MLPRPSGPPNILIVIADDHRHDCVHGDRVTGPATPTLTALARRGTTFAGARIVGGDNPAVCIPNRAALLTGCPPRRALTRSEIIACPEDAQDIRPDRILLGETLGHAGYRTFSVGKWHNDPASFNRCFADGAALLFHGMCAHESPPLRRYDPSGRYPDTEETPAPGFSTELFADAAIRFIEDAASDPTPFFLYVAFTSPHDPRTPPEDYRRRYDPAAIRLPANFLPRHPFDNGELLIRDELLAGLPRQPDEIRRHLAEYYAMIEHHDHHMGRILDALERAGKLADTVVVYMADHGLAIGSHGLMGKQNLYEHSVRVPLIMSGPGVPAGRVVHRSVHAHRVFPTLCGLAGVPVPPGVESAPLPLSAVPGDPPAGPHFSHYRDLQRMVKDGPWKLIAYHVNGARRTQLFNLDDDPHELRDLSALPGMETHVARLSRQLDAWWADYARPADQPPCPLPAALNSTA